MGFSRLEYTLLDLELTYICEYVCAKSLQS